MQRIALSFALVLGIGVDVFFAAVNFYPVAPPRTQGRIMQVVADMGESHATWFRTHVLDAFNREHNARLQLRIVPSDQLLHALSEPDVAAMVLPGTERAEAIGQGSLRELSAPSMQSIARALGGESNPLVVASEHEGKLFFLPRLHVLDLAAYRPSKVRDAVLHWTEIETQIQTALRRVNGFGLPRGYELERTPADWDAFDQFVIAYFWAHRSYGGLPAHARVAHRTDDGLPGEVFLLSMLYRAGARDDTVSNVDDAHVLDLFEWESLYRAEGLYAPEMFRAGGMSAEGILAAFHQGKVFLASVDQMEAFRLHGGSDRSAPAEFADPDDLSFYALPRGASLALDAHHQPQRTASAFSFREDLFWAIPKTTSDPQLAEQFLEFVWSRENHVRECESLGVLPIRRDVVTERVSIFRLGWQQEIFEATLLAWPHAEVVPPSLLEANVASRYAGQWRSLIAAQEPTNPIATREALRERLQREVPSFLLRPQLPLLEGDRDDGQPWRDAVRFEFTAPTPSANGESR